MLHPGGLNSEQTNNMFGGSQRFRILSGSVKAAVSPTLNLLLPFWRVWGTLRRFIIDMTASLSQLSHSSPAFARESPNGEVRYEWYNHASIVL